jgi:hypothetical protein
MEHQFLHLKMAGKGQELALCLSVKDVWQRTGNCPFTKRQAGKYPSKTRRRAGHDQTKAVPKAELGTHLLGGLSARTDFLVLLTPEALQAPLSRRPAAAGYWQM